MITQTAAYLVPFAELKRAAGSGERQLFAAIVEDCSALLEEADGNRNEDVERTCEQALADLIDGIDLDEVPDEEGSLYGLALEAMCAHLGEFAGEVNGEWGELLDGYFEVHGVSLSFSALVIGDTVVELPFYSGPYPIIGSWPPALKTVAEAMAALDLEAMRAEEEEMAEVVAEVRGWVQEASKRSGWGIIAFSL